MGVRDDDYRYLKIVDAFPALNQKVNLIGIVVDFGVPKRSKGTDCFCSVRITDDSHQSRGLLVNIFAETEEKLPQIESSGDIIVLCHVVIKAHNKENYALYNKRFSSFALYEGKYGENFGPYQVSSLFRPREQDKKFVAGLRKVLDGFQLDIGSWGSTALLREIKEGEHADLVVKILHVYEVAKDEVMLFVWDGTDAPVLQMQSKLENEKEAPLPLQLEAQPLPREILSTFPTVGTVLRVKIDQGHEKLCLSSLRTGKWARFINLTFEVYAGLWYGVFKSFTRIRYMPDEDHLIVKRKRDSQDRLSLKWDRMPFTSFPWPSDITETEDRDVPFVTLMDITTYTKVTAKFKCVVRVVAAFPWKPEDFCPLGQTYRMRLTLEDPTARIHAYVYAVDGETFFGGYPSADLLIRQRNKLLGIADSDSGGAEDAPRNPPWVQCCIKSYYLDKSEIWGSRNYRIFGTRLFGP